MKLSICAGVSKVFFNLADIKKGVHEAYSANLVNILDDYIRVGA